MSKHYTAENSATMETLIKVYREENTQRSIPSGNNSQESQKYLLTQRERAHQQNKHCSEDDSYELMNHNGNSSSSDSYQTKNFATIQKQISTSEECKFWNNGKCTKQSCKYQHFSFKPLIKQNNPEINLSPNEAIQINKLIIIEVTELKYVPIDQIEQIITQQLPSDTKKRLIKLAITNKRRHKKLISQIKLNKHNKNNSDDQSQEDWKEIIKNIDELKNNNKQIVSSNQTNQKPKINEKTKTSPITKGEHSPNYNQESNQQILNSNIKASNETDINAQTPSEEENQSSNTAQTIQGREQGRLANSLVIDSEGDVRYLLQQNQNNPERILQHNGEDLFVELNKPSGKIGYIQMAQTYSMDQEKIIFQEGLEVNEVANNKLITQVKYRREIETRMKHSNREFNKFTKITFYLNKIILSKIYFQNIKAFTKMDNLIPTIRYYNRCCAKVIEDHVERWVSEREPDLYQVMKKEYKYGDTFEYNLNYYLIPKLGVEVNTRKVAQTRSFSFLYRPKRNSDETPTKTIIFVMKIPKFTPIYSAKAKKTNVYASEN